MLQRPEERNPWQPGLRRTTQAHDDNENVEVPRKHYFGPAKYYCVETVCAPCGVVIAWTKFDKSESPTNILNFLESVYPTEESRPAYICIDKACQVLRTAISNGSWNIWKKTTCFIVDAYHYINHRTLDYLCRKWCNPAPLNGSAPNLIRVAYDKNQQEYLQRAFNTQVCISLYYVVAIKLIEFQACEQLNSWIGGFESILKRMKTGNFDWFLHSMLFYHTQHTIQKQRQQEQPHQIDANDNDEGDEDEEDHEERHWNVEDD